MNNEFKGTKGKWSKVISNKGSIMVKSEADENGLVELNISLGKISDDDCTVPSCCKKAEHANALLISKAPELLEKLKYLYAMDLLKDHEESVLKLIQEATILN